MSTKKRNETAFGGTKIPDACSHIASHVTSCVIASPSHAGARCFMQAGVHTPACDWVAPLRGALNFGIRIKQVVVFAVMSFAFYWFYGRFFRP